MYYEEKRKNREKMIVYIGMIVIIMLLLVVMIRVMGIENGQAITTPGYVAEKLDTEVEIPEKKETKQIPVDAIVGISKLKQIGTSVFVSGAEEKLGLGSGVIITDNGYIVSNQHVTGNKYSTCYITLDDGKVYEGSVVWADSNIDLAIVKINKGNLEYLELGDSDDIYLAEEVYTIGNPLGMEFQKTVTKGIISGLNRTIRMETEVGNVYMEDLIQTDATINEGNSGGALIDSDGKLIGINSVKISNAEGIGFAVPINIIKPIINELIQNGRFDEAWLGIYGYDKEAIRYLDSNIEIDTGIYVAQVAADGPLANLDVKEGDIITQIDATEINKMNDLKKYIYTKKIGDTVILSVQRENKNFFIEAILSGKN